MQVEVQEVSKLLKGVKQLQKHQQEIEKIKGESFNIFSILNVERKENKTHSNFIAELLNPKGSHYMGNVFLKAFIVQINYKGNLNSSEASVIKEFPIGQKKDITGGRIDILIKDKSNNYISIENKIDAGDQDNQLIRYSNYKKENNTLYYLSLFGDEASEKSTLYIQDNKTIHLKAGKDYHTISYAKDILQWLHTCQCLAINTPQLRDSIKQYELLIKKLTHQMIDPKSKDIKKLIFEHHQSATFIANSFQNMKNGIKAEFRIAMVEELCNITDPSLYNYAYPNPVDKNGIAQIYVELKNYKTEGLQFIIESFSGFGHHNGALFIGVYDHTSQRHDYPKSGDIDGLDTLYFKSAMFITYNDERIHLEDAAFLKHLVDADSKSYKDLVNDCASQCVEFIEANYSIIENYLLKHE